MQKKKRGKNKYNQISDKVDECLERRGNGDENALQIIANSLLKGQKFMTLK